MTRILSVVTLVTPSGDYGGPVRVAVNQAKALIDRGHDVQIVGGYSGYASPPVAIDGVPCRLFPVRRVIPGAGFSGLVAPALIRWLIGNVAGFDAVHVHVARDLITLPAAAIAEARGVRCFLQSHGMIDASQRRSAAVLDAAMTRRVLRRARTVFHLTERERRDLLGVEPRLTTLTELPNGVPVADRRPAQSSEPKRTEVLYLARLAPRKRPMLFVEVAQELSDEFPDAAFTLVGPDEGEGEAITETLRTSVHRDRITWEGPLSPEETISRMRAADIYVLPSVNEPYPMSVLEAMSVGLPVVVTDSCGLADFVAANGAGVVVDETADALRAAVRGLLEDPAAAHDMGARAMAVVRSERSMDAVAELLENHYTTIGI